jgi:hypothetical protein
MKSRLITIALCLLSKALYCQPEPGFSPNAAPLFRAAMGTVVKFQTIWKMPFFRNFPATHIHLQGYPGITADPTDFDASFDGFGVPITITVSDSTVCYLPTDGICSSGSQDLNGCFLVCRGLFFDPKSVDHATAHPVTSLWSDQSDSVNFGSVGVFSSATKYFVILTGKLSAYRTFDVIRQRSPFQILDTIPLSYGCLTDFGGVDIPTPVSFDPIKPGHFVDTVLLLDPLTNDTIPLVLIGDAVDADVSETPDQALKLYPNPSDRNLSIQLPEDEVADIEIRNLLGERIYSSRMLSNEASIDCSTLPNGVYVALISTVNARISRKVVISH